MIKIVAIKTAIAKTNYASKTIVNAFQLIYVIATFVIIENFDDTAQQLFKSCAIVLFLIFALRLVVLARFPKICGFCHKPLAKDNSTTCPACGNYNVYDLKLWSKLEFDTVKAAHKAEKSRTLQNIVALIIVVLMFSSPIFYFVLVIDKDIRHLNQQRQTAFVQNRHLFLRYKAEHGIFPESLEQLVPDYIEAIPSSLINPKENTSKTLKINYQADENTAKFIFNVTHVPNLSVSYDIAKDEYSSDSKLAQLLLRP